MHPRFLVQHIPKDAVLDIPVQKGPGAVDRRGTPFQGKGFVPGPVIIELDAVLPLPMSRIAVPIPWAAGNTEKEEDGQKKPMQNQYLKIGTKKRAVPESTAQSNEINPHYSSSSGGGGGGGF